MQDNQQKPWDERLVEWMQRGSDTAGLKASRDLRGSVVAGVVGGVAGGQLADGRWWYMAGVVATAVIYRLGRWALGRTRSG
jgi:hypothetical protein